MIGTTPPPATTADTVSNDTAGEENFDGHYTELLAQKVKNILNGRIIIRWDLRASDTQLSVGRLISQVHFHVLNRPRA